MCSPASGNRVQAHSNSPPPHTHTTDTFLVTFHFDLHITLCLLTPTYSYFVCRHLQHAAAMATCGALRPNIEGDAGPGVGMAG
jgi:hypothetical protein